MGTPSMEVTTSCRGRQFLISGRSLTVAIFFGDLWPASLGDCVILSTPLELEDFWIHFWVLFFFCKISFQFWTFRNHKQYAMTFISSYYLFGPKISKLLPFFFFRFTPFQFFYSILKVFWSARTLIKIECYLTYFFWYFRY